MSNNYNDNIVKIPSYTHDRICKKIILISFYYFSKEAQCNTEIDLLSSLTNTNNDLIIINNKFKETKHNIINFFFEIIDDSELINEYIEWYNSEIYNRLEHYQNFKFLLKMDNKFFNRCISIFYLVQSKLRVDDMKRIWGINNYKTYNHFWSKFENYNNNLILFINGLDLNNKNIFFNWMTEKYNDSTTSLK
jgi:hypothetical protein